MTIALAQFIQHVCSHPSDHLIVFDVDDVVTRTGPHWIGRAIQKFGMRRILQGHSATEVHMNYRYLEYCPWLHEDAEVMAWLATLPRDPDSYACDPVEDALEVISLIHERILPIGAYLTARPDVMAWLTITWLRMHKFPEAPVIHRPNEMHYEQAHAWKKSVLRSGYPRVVGIVEDHPKMPEHLFGDDPYEGELYHFTHTRTSAHPRVTTCPTHQDLLEALANRYKNGKRL